MKAIFRLAAKIETDDQVGGVIAAGFIFLTFCAIYSTLQMF